MRTSALPLLVILSLAPLGCQSKPAPSSSNAPAPTQVASTQPAPQSPAPAPAIAPSPAEPAPAPRPKLRQSAQDIAQLDLNQEGGVRDGSYAMWVHVAQNGKAVKSLNVIAYNADDKPAATARTNADGDAMLKVQATTYRIAATEGHLHAEQTVTFHPGDQYELDLAR